MYGTKNGEIKLCILQFKTHLWGNKVLQFRTGMLQNYWVSYLRDGWIMQEVMSHNCWPLPIIHLLISRPTIQSTCVEIIFTIGYVLLSIELSQTVILYTCFCIWTV